MLTYNINHPKVNALLERSKMLENTESMIDFKMRSKLYLNYKEAINHINLDISKKIPAIFPNSVKGEKHPLKIISLMNPAFTVMSELAQKLFEQFGPAEQHWDEKCCSAMFLTEGSEDESDDDVLPQTWMFKYETFYVEDLIELVKNGEYAFNPANVATQNFNSTYQ